jgi:hypothetical protein
VPNAASAPVDLAPVKPPEIEHADDASRLVSSAATEGPIRGARVYSYAIDGFVFATGNAIATTTTDDSGNFSVSLPASARAVLVVTSGRPLLMSPTKNLIPSKTPDCTIHQPGACLTLAAGGTTVAIVLFTEGLLSRPARSPAY